MDALPLQRALEDLASQFGREGWALSGPPTQVLAMSQRPAEGVDHVLFVNEPWNLGTDPVPGTLRLACTVNVHFPTLEACINEALGRDASEAGRQSLRLSLANFAPADHLVDGLAHADLPLLREDFARYLEPVRAQLASLDVLARESLPPHTVDPWTWYLRQAAWLHLHGPVDASRRFLTWLQAQADQLLSEEGGAREHPRVHRAAEEALALADALMRPRRRVIRLAAAA